MNYSVYTASSKGQNDPMITSLVQDNMSRSAANQLAKSMRVKRESNNTKIGVWDGQKFKSLY